MGLRSCARGWGGHRLLPTKTSRFWNRLIDSVPFDFESFPGEVSVVMYVVGLPYFALECNYSVCVEYFVYRVMPSGDGPLLIYVRCLFIFLLGRHTRHSPCNLAGQSTQPVSFCGVGTDSAWRGHIGMDLCVCRATNWIM